MWNERFSEPGFAYGTDPNDFLVEVAHTIPRGRVLCLAEGEGRNAAYLARLGYDVTAVDLSDVGREKAMALADERGVAVDYKLADLATFDIQRGSWQAIVSIFCHLPPPARAHLHARCVRGLAIGGVLVLEGFATRQLELGTGGPKSRELLYELDVLRGDFVGLELEIAREVERPLIEGAYHTGVASVVQILGVKPLR
ncbi:MAG: class I SAM-dependent methyltransferase [Holophagae bacterium]|jgi:SAM-dependent methyltransferase